MQRGGMDTASWGTCRLECLAKPTAAAIWPVGRAHSPKAAALARQSISRSSLRFCKALFVPLIADRDEVQREPERLRAVTAGALG